ncbi:CPBP family intramembrane metalloprotease [Horticoccus luteus]|uniref:CPBP family intramembrane metalloprotease n=1 Tax=Horticoccus luteus TaxID=2862869 RepID=A0A8F9TS06_9BACT|nr:type II CAAX endopeptidase family protein [Horticoccus luteus]QYM77941.1 CPBP family intramembrane metalloprotease [Horticoccus luteus]
MFSSSARLAVFALEGIFFLAGVVLLWWQGLSAAGRAAPRPLGAWRISKVDFLLFAWLAITAALVAQLAAGALVTHAALTDTQKMLIAGGALHFGLIGGLVLFRLRLDRDAARWRLDAAAWRAGATTFLIVLPVVAVVSLLWQNLLLALGVPIEEQDIVDMFAHADSPGLLIAMTLLATVVAPVGEELLFRAGLFRYLRTRVPRWGALLLPAVLFGALHVNLATFMPLVALGVVFSLAYERTDNAAVTMIAHGLFNLNTVLLVLAGVSK